MHRPTQGVSKEPVKIKTGGKGEGGLSVSSRPFVFQKGVASCLMALSLSKRRTQLRSEIGNTAGIAQAHGFAPPVSELQISAFKRFISLLLRSTGSFTFLTVMSLVGLFLQQELNTIGSILSW